MKKQMKKILALTLALVFAVSLAACQSDPVVHPEAVIMEKDSITLEVGQAETLTAIVDLNATDRSVTWSSSDSSVASVDATGKVTALAEGSATITVTTNDGGKTATCSVTVTPAPAAVALEVYGINVLGEVSDTDIITFRDDGTYSVYAMFLGSVEVAYESTYEIVDGVLTVPNPGPNVSTTFGDFPTYPTVEVYGDTVRFSVYSENSTGQITLGYYVLSSEDAGKLGITVGEPIVEVAATGISLSQDSVALLSGSKLDLTGIVNVLPEDATNKDYTVAIKTDTNAANILMEDAGVVGLNTGIASVVITTVDGGFTAELPVAVVFPDRAASVSESNFFAEETAFAGQMDLTAFGGSVNDLVYIFKPDGSIEIFKNYVINQYGYYSLVGNADNYTAINLQLFFDGETSKELTLTDGKLSLDMGFAGLPAILTQCEMDTNVYFDTAVTFTGLLDLSAIVPNFVQEKTFICNPDGTVTTLTDGIDDGTTNQYHLISINGQIISIYLDLGADGISTCTLNQADGVRSFTLPLVNLTMTEQQG